MKTKVAVLGLLLAATALATAGGLNVSVNIGGGPAYYGRGYCPPVYGYGYRPPVVYYQQPVVYRSPTYNPYYGGYGTPVYQVAPPIRPFPVRGAGFGWR